MHITKRQFIVQSAAMVGGLFAAPMWARSDKSLRSPIKFDPSELTALVDAAVAGHNTPGIALCVWQSGKQIYSRCAGFANLETGTPVVDDSVFRIGSLTKQFAAAIVLQLQQAGKLTLADPVHHHLPFLAIHEPFTIQALLNHTAGVHDSEADVTPLKFTTQIDQAKQIAVQDVFFDFPPGTAWLYSNANYILIGAIIEKITGLSLADAAAKMLCKPVGLDHTAFDTTSDVVAGRASGYTPTDNANQPFINAEYLDVQRAGAAGAMRSTAADLCRWHHVLFHGSLFAKSLLAEMTRPGRLRNGQLASTNRFSENDKLMGDTQYGLGLMLDNNTIDKSLIVNHHGGINGFAAYLASHPASGLSYACLCNVDTHPGLPLRDLRRTIFRSILPVS
jgi:D-alanyl-D-alanine carboxypeptidase